MSGRAFSNRKPHLQLLNINVPGAICVKQVEGLPDLLLLLFSQLRLGTRFLPLGRCSQRGLLEAGGLGIATQEQTGIRPPREERESPAERRPPQLAPGPLQADRGGPATPLPGGRSRRTALTIPAAACLGAVPVQSGRCSILPSPIG